MFELDCNKNNHKEDANCKLHIGIVGPISTENIAQFINNDITELPKGYSGAPFMGTLIGTLLSRGHKVTAFTTSADLSLNLLQPVTAEGKNFKIHYCPMRKHSLRMNGYKLGRIVDFFKLERRYLEQAIRLDNPDIVHAHWAYEFSLAAIASERPYLITCHDAPLKILKYMPNLYRLGRYFMALTVMLSAKSLTTVSPYLRDSLLSQARGVIEIIPNPLPHKIANRIGETKKPFDKINPKIIIISNGWDKLKNPKVALLAFSQLRKTNRNAKLRVYGGGFGKGEVAESWAKSKGISEGIEFIGRLPYDKLIDEIAAADILLHPSLEESFGMVIAESMALGLPIVGGRDSGAVPWVVGNGGLLVDVKNSTEISEALMKIINNDILRENLSNSARQESLQRFSPETITTAYENLYRKEIKNYEFN